MIESAPKVESRDLSKAIRISSNPVVKQLVDKINQEYDYWSDVKYKKLPEGITSSELWACVKLNRLLSSRELTFGKHVFVISITDNMQRICHNFDMNLGGYMGAQSIITSEDKDRYLVSSIMEEAIASSQMEGAATTRRVAKEMLRKEISPRSRSEQMILNNYETIRYIVAHKDERLSSESLLYIHKLMTSKTLESPENEGRFRQDNEVWVENKITQEVAYVPPDFGIIGEFVESICNFFNEESTNKAFIHPIIKGIIIHFMIAYLHPFVDGNGRTARAVFYWYMLNRGYWLTEYLSISRIIARSKNQYEKAYLYTEKDGNDLGYFIAYNLRVMDLSYKELHQYIQRKIDEKGQTSDFLRLGNLNERQAMIVKWLFNEPKISFTVKEIQNRFVVSNPTARLDLEELVAKGFLETVAVNRVKQSYIKSSRFDELIRSVRNS